MVFLNYDQAELDRQYDQRAWAPNALKIIQEYTEKSEQVRKLIGEPEVHAYGPSAAETLDLYRAASSHAPIHIFIHGGAWRMLNKRGSAFMANSFTRAGAHFIALDFGLIPAVTLSEMVDQVRRAVAWVVHNAEQLGGDASRIHLSGHSSGAHLAACVAVHNWSAVGLPVDAVKSTICASGIYDLLPVRLSARNDYVKLDAISEQALSPIRHLPNLSGKVFVACGEFESEEFKRQGREFADRLGALLVAPFEEYAGLNHFEVANTLATPTSGLGLVALRLMGLH